MNTLKKTIITNQDLKQINTNQTDSSSNVVLPVEPKEHGNEDSSKARGMGEHTTANIALSCESSPEVGVLPDRISNETCICREIKRDVDCPLHKDSLTEREFYFQLNRLENGLFMRGKVLNPNSHEKHDRVKIIRNKLWNDPALRYFINNETPTPEPNDIYMILIQAASSLIEDLIPSGIGLTATESYQTVIENETKQFVISTRTKYNNIMGKVTYAFLTGVLDELTYDKLLHGVLSELMEVISMQQRYREYSDLTIDEVKNCYMRDGKVTRKKYDPMPFVADYRFLTGQDIADLMDLLNVGASSTQIDDFKRDCYKRNKDLNQSPSTEVVYNTYSDWELGRSLKNNKQNNNYKNTDITELPTIPDPSTLSFYADYFKVNKGVTWNPPAAALRSSFNLGGYANKYPTKYKLKMIFTGVFSGSYDQISFTATQWITNVTAGAIPPYVGGSGLFNSSDVDVAGILVVVSLSTSCPMFVTDIECPVRYAPTIAMSAPLYLETNLTVPNVNTGAVRVYATWFMEAVFQVQESVAIVGVSVDPLSSYNQALVVESSSAITDVRIIDSTTIIDTNVVNSVPVTVNIANSIPITVGNVVDTVITDVKFDNDNQYSVLRTQDIGSVYRNEHVKYDHKGKEPNDYDYCSNMYTILIGLPDTVLGHLIDDDDNDIGPVASIRQDGGVMNGKLVKEEERKERKKKTADNLPIKEFESILREDLSNRKAQEPVKEQKKDMPEKNRLTSLYYAAMQRANSIKKQSNSQDSRILNFCKYYVNFLNNGHDGKAISKFFLKRVLMALDLDVLIPLVEPLMTFGELSYLCTSIVFNMKFDASDDFILLADNLENWAQNQGYMVIRSRQSSGNGLDIYEIINLARQSSKVAKYSHMGKEPNDSVEEEIVLSDLEIPDIPDYTESRIFSDYPSEYLETHNFLNDRTELELFALTQIAKELGKESVTMAEANDFIRHGAREANYVDKIVTAIATWRDNNAKYLGPGYTGGSFAPIDSVTELAERFAIRPGSDLDAIARVHDLMKTLHTTEGGRRVADEKMLQLIDSIRDPSLQASASRFVISNFATPYQQHIMLAPEPFVPDVTYLEPVDQSSFDRQISTSQINHILETVPQIISPIVTKTFDEMTFEEFMQSRRNRRMGPTNREMHAMNGNTVSPDKLKKLIVAWMDRFCGQSDDLTSPFGFMAGMSNNTMNNADFIYWKNYLRYRAPNSTQKLIYRSLDTQQPIDGYTGMPELYAGIVYDLTSVFEPVGGVGPALSTGELASMFQDADEQDLTKVISAMRTNTAITSATTNLGIWAMTRDSTGNDHLTGSNAMLLTKLWLLIDQMSATCEISPIWNNADDKYCTPQNNNPVQPVVYFPNYGIPNIHLRFWAMTQQQYIATNFLSQNFVVANFNPAKAIFVLITQEFLDQSNRQALNLKTTTQFPFPFLHFDKLCNKFDLGGDVQNNLYFSSTNEIRIDHQKRLPETDPVTLERYFNVVYVVAGFTGTTQNNGWDFQFTVPLSAGNVGSVGNNPTIVGNVFVLDNGGANSIGTDLRQLSVLTSGGAAIMVERFWSDYYGTKDELARAFYLYCLAKYRFNKVPCVHSSCDQMVAGQSLDGAMMNRNAGGVRLIGQGQNQVGSVASFVMHDMFGVRCTDLNSGYLYSSMATKYQLAMITQIRKATVDKLPINGIIPLQPEQRFIYGLEIASAFAMLYSKTLQEIGLPRTQYYSYEGLNIGGNNEISFQDTVLDDMLDIMDLGKFVIRKSIPWNNTQNADGAVFDSYAVTPIIHELCFAITSAWDMEDQSDTRDCTSIVSAKGMISGNSWQKSVIGVLAALVNYGHHGGSFNFNILAFLKLWQPNIVMLGIDTNFVGYNLSANRRIYLGNMDTRKAFKIMNPAVIPSGRNYYNQIVDHIPGAVALLTDIGKMHIYPASTYTVPPDTSNDIYPMNIVMSSEMVNILLNGSQRLFQSNNANTVAVQLFPSSSININPSNLRKFTQKKGTGTVVPVDASEEATK